jgi:hypothetical protein
MGASRAEVLADGSLSVGWIVCPELVEGLDFETGENEYP